MVQWKAPPPQTVVFILMSDNRVRPRERKYDRRSKAHLCVRTIPDARVLLNGSRALILPHPLHTQYILLERTWGAVAQPLLGQS
jgi:hypothetical protein